MDKNSKIIVSYMFVAKKLQNQKQNQNKNQNKNPNTTKEALDFIENNRNLFKINNSQIRDLKKEIENNKK
jgi:uncharacterized protein HemX